jgi:spore coat polysaccharide biosynthesis predicted glycosyltransferase SpsG
MSAALAVELAADGSPGLGAGHQVRMASLAIALAARGHRILLAARDLPGSPHGWAWRGLPQRLLAPAPPPGEALGRLLAETAPDWCVVDHYDIAPAELRAAAPQVRLLALDDVPGRDLAGADLVLNQNLGVAPDEYPQPALVGPRYCLLRPAFRGGGRVAARAAAGAVLVMLGGTDCLGLGPALARALAASGREALVVGAPSAQEPGLRFTGILTAAELAAAMRASRAGVLGAGSAVFEALALGLPFVAVRSAANQDRLAAGLRALAIPVVEAEAAVAAAPSLVAALPAELPRVVDGQGAERVAQALEGWTPLPAGARSPR